MQNIVSDRKSTAALTHNIIYYSVVFIIVVLYDDDGVCSHLRAKGQVLARTYPHALYIRTYHTGGLALNKII